METHLGDLGTHPEPPVVSLDVQPELQAGTRSFSGLCGEGHEATAPYTKPNKFPYNQPRRDAQLWVG